MLTFIATIVVAVLNIVGIKIQTKSKEKQDNLMSKLEQFRLESKTEDEKIKALLNTSSLSSIKCWLMGELNKIKMGHYVPNEEMKMLLHEAKRRYNKLGGDSYVDTVFDDLHKKGLL